jgi:hypothetical protein
LANLSWAANLTLHFSRDWLSLTPRSPASASPRLPFSLSPNPRHSSQSTPSEVGYSSTTRRRAPLSNSSTSLPRSHPGPHSGASRVSLRSPNEWELSLQLMIHEFGMRVECSSAPLPLPPLIAPHLTFHFSRFTFYGLGFIFHLLRFTLHLTPQITRPSLLASLPFPISSRYAPHNRSGSKRPIAIIACVAARRSRACRSFIPVKSS